MASTVDDIDRAILTLLQQDARTTLEQLGDAVGLSAAAVQRRIGRLRETGVLEGSYALVDPRAAGVPISVLVLATLETDGGPESAALDDELVAHPNVQQVYELAGNFDRAVVITAPDMETYRELARELFDNDPNVQRFASHVVMGTLKRTLALPLR